MKKDILGGTMYIPSKFVLLSSEVCTHNRSCRPLEKEAASGSVYYNNNELHPFLISENRHLNLRDRLFYLFGELYEQKVDLKNFLQSQ